jgi:amidase
MARSVADVARSFSVLCGSDPRDPWSLARNPAVATSSALVPRARGAKIGFDARYAEEGVDEVVVSAIRATLDVFRQLGADIVELELPSVDGALGAWAALGSAEIATSHAETYPSKKEQYGDALAATIETGLAVTGREVAHAWKERIAFARRLEGCFAAGGQTCPPAAPNGLDAILAPVIPSMFAANTNLADVAANPKVVLAMRYTSPFNLSGSPSLTMPAGLDPDGAPIGFQLVGAHRAESKLLALGAAYQSATDHHNMHPRL